MSSNLRTVMAALMAKSLPIKINEISRNVKILTSAVICNRQISLGETYCSKNQLSKQGKILRKIMVGGSRKKWYKDPAYVLEKPKLGSSEFLKPSKTRVNRRVTVLNSVLMHNICDVISTGELSPQLIGLGLEITRVKVNDHFICVNVYWTTSIAENTDIIQELLHSHAGNLRIILNSLRIFGNIPYIIFVKDFQMQNQKDVEYALKRADFGSDFVPTERSQNLRSTPVLKQTIPDLPELLIEEDRKAERSHLKFEPLISTSSSAPEHMRMDIFGLNHQQMFTTVVQKMKAAKACHRTTESGVPMGTNSSTDETSEQNEDERLGSEVVKRNWSSLPDPTAELKKILRRADREKQKDHSKEEVKRLLTEEISPPIVAPVLGRHFSELYNEDDYYEEEEHENERERDK